VVKGQKRKNGVTNEAPLRRLHGEGRAPGGDELGKVLQDLENALVCKILGELGAVMRGRVVYMGKKDQ